MILKSHVLFNYIDIKTTNSTISKFFFFFLDKIKFSTGRVGLQFPNVFHKTRKKKFLKKHKINHTHITPIVNKN